LLLHAATAASSSKSTPTSMTGLRTAGPRVSTEALSDFLPNSAITYPSADGRGPPD
jgi:hypothetical protein